MAFIRNRSVALGLVLAAGVGALASVTAIAPIEAAPTGWRVRAAAAVPATVTRIEVDQQGNAIRFFVSGEEIAMLDASGLHVDVLSPYNANGR
jgi:hypothetical protein